ncbi:MAG: DUF1127 domain-containing protein [Rhodospirillales bacterium]
MSTINCNDTMPTTVLPLDNAGWRLLQRFSPALAAAAMSQFATLCEWQRRAETRHHLAQLDERMLADIGLGRSEAEIEASKPFWQK